MNVTFVVGSLLAIVCCQPSVGDSMVLGCNQVTLVEPELGNAFQGTVSIEDYALSAVIPNGMTGWGPSEGAPFHGFTIFVDSQKTACIVFDVHIRIEDDEAPKRPSHATLIQLGRGEGWQSISEGLVGGLSFINVNTFFSFKRGNRVDDGSIVLIAAKSRFKNATSVYDAFVHSIKFGH